MRQFLKTNVNSPIEFISGGQFISKQSWVHSKRNIDSYEMIIGVNKTLYIQQDDVQYEVKPGDVLLLLPNHVHLGYKNCSPGISFYWFHFYCTDNEELINESTMDNEVLTYRSKINSRKTNATIFIPIYNTPTRIERVNILFNQLLDVSNANYYNSYGVDYLATSILIEVSEQTITNFYTTNDRSQTDKNIVNILEWIRIHSMGEISIQSIADSFNYNKDYLSRIFKKRTGMNIQEYIHSLKISKAKDLLSRTNQSIKQVAYTVGISDEKYFMKLFKKYERVTPTEFRKAYYRTHLNNK